ncbi:UNVERIFIED_CONTAM: hypothetical protein NCL1_49014 [Trichonephila clavipes]
MYFGFMSTVGLAGVIAFPVRITLTSLYEAKKYARKLQGQSVIDFLDTHAKCCCSLFFCHVLCTLTNIFNFLLPSSHRIDEKSAVLSLRTYYNILFCAFRHGKLRRKKRKFNGNFRTAQKKVSGGSISSEKLGLSDALFSLAPELFLGFGLMVTTACVEWTMYGFYLLYLITFYSEFLCCKFFVGMTPKEDEE